MNIIRRIPHFLVLIFAALTSFCEVACSTAQLAQAEAVGASLVPLVQQGSVLASDAYAVYQSSNQNLTTANVISGKLSVSKVITGAQAILGSSTTAQASQSLLTAANTFVSDINGSIATYKAAGATAQATIAAVSQSGAATVASIAAVAPTTPTTSLTSPKPFLVTACIRPEYGSVAKDSAYDLHVARKS